MDIYPNTCMFLDEASYNTLPRSFTNVIEFCRKSSNNNLTLHDYAAILIYVSMLEIGFVSIHYGFDDLPDKYFNYQRLLRNTQLFVPNELFSRQPVRTMYFSLPIYPRPICKLVLIQSEDDIIVNGSVDSPASTNVSFLIDPLYYIVLPRNLPVLSTGDNDKRIVFQHLKMFSYKFKSLVGYHLKKRILTSNCALNGYVGNLPPELMLIIYRFCNSKTKRILETVNNIF